MKDIIMRFSVIEDSRHSGYVVHKLEHILTIVMCAVLCGLDKLDEIMTYQENTHERECHSGRWKSNPEHRRKR